jgi:hypothetical protein
MRALGQLRCRVLACMFADNPRTLTHFDPPRSADLGEALRTHLQKWFSATEVSDDARLIIAAGLLTFGSLEAAGFILERLPTEQVTLDHGAGWCSLLPYEAAAALLPIPQAIRNSRKWVEGTPEAQELRRWFAANRSLLAWDPAREVFRIDGEGRSKP